MSLLELDGVCKHGREGRRERTLLDDVTISLQVGELAVVLGARRSEC